MLPATTSTNAKTSAGSRSTLSLMAQRSDFSKPTVSQPQPQQQQAEGDSYMGQPLPTTTDLSIFYLPYQLQRGPAQELPLVHPPLPRPTPPSSMGTYIELVLRSHFDQVYKVIPESSASFPVNSSQVWATPGCAGLRLVRESTGDVCVDFNEALTCWIQGLFDDDDSYRDLFESAVLKLLNEKMRRLDESWIYIPDQPPPVNSNAGSSGETNGNYFCQDMLTSLRKAAVDPFGLIPPGSSLSSWKWLKPMLDARRVMVLGIDCAPHAEELPTRVQQVRIGPSFQADVPEWMGKNITSDSKWLGARFWPTEYELMESRLKFARRVRPKYGEQVEPSVLLD